MQSTSTALLLLLAGSAASAQQYVISTVAGGAPLPPAAALSVSIGQPTGVAVDASGNFYFASLNCVYKVGSDGMLVQIAGNSRAGYSGDGGPATAAQLNGPYSLAVDSAGNVYIADTYNSRIRKVSAAGVISTVAGTGADGYAGDGGQATNAKLSSPTGVAVGGGNLYIADAYNRRIRKVSSDGVITTVAGTGTQGSTGDGGSATAARLDTPLGVALDGGGNLYIADAGGNSIRKVTSGGSISTIAGNGSGGYGGDGGAPTDAQLFQPVQVALDSAGNLYIADQGNNRIRLVSGGTITTVAGSSTQGFAGDRGRATNARLSSPIGVAVDGSGNFYIADQGNKRVRKASSDGIITTVAGNGAAVFSGDGGSATAAQLSSADGVAVDGSGNLFIADSVTARVRKVSPAGAITTVAGNGTEGFSGDNGQATNARLNSPTSVAVDRAGNLYIADSRNNRIRKVNPAGVISTVAGTGTVGDSGDGGPATSARMSIPKGVAVDPDGVLYIADSNNYRVRKVSSTGIITSFAGNGAQGYSGDGGPAAAARIHNLRGIALDNAGNLYLADLMNARVRKVSSDGTITTVAGNGTAGYSGDGGQATDAQLAGSIGNSAAVAVDGAGNLFIADTGQSRIRMVSPDGIITTVAGDGTLGYSGDGGPATAAQLLYPSGLAVDGAGNVYIADSENSAVRILQTPGADIAITNGASNLVGPIAPGEIVVIYGSGIGPAQLARAQLNDAGLFDTQLAGTSVAFNGLAAPMIYASAAQVSAVVPYGVADATAQVTVTYQRLSSNAITVPVAASAPGLFTSDSSGKGQAAALNQNGSLNSAAAPAPIGSIVSLFATGEGQTTPPGIDGKPAAVPLPRPTLPVTVTIGGKPVTPQYAGGAPGQLAGLVQINVEIPPGIQPGNAVPVQVQIGATTTQPGVTLAVGQ